MRRWFHDVAAAFAWERTSGPLCAEERCAEPVRQHGARCLEHRGPWDRERRRLAERERRHRARLGRESNVSPPDAGFETNVEVPSGSSRNAYQSSKAAGTGPMVVVGLDPATGPSIPPAEKRWRARPT